jgi:biotin synthase
LKKNIFNQITTAPDGLDRDSVNIFLSMLAESPWEAIHMAGRKRAEVFGNKVDACSIINARSGNCSEDCAFCAQSAHHRAEADIYKLLPKSKILETAQRAYDNGVRRFCIVTSGRGIDSEGELGVIASCVESIRKIGIQPCATLGTLDRGQLKTLKDAGLNRFHHNIETSRRFFPNICTTHDYDERVATLNDAKDVGLSLCSGGIIGLGETMEDRADMAFALRDIGVDSVPINFLMPIPGTPLEGADFMTPMEALKTIALFRMILPDKEIRICGGRVSALRDLHPMIFNAGANGLLMGDYLTTRGRDYAMDHQMLEDLGLKLTDE